MVTQGAPFLYSRLILYICSDWRLGGGRLAFISALISKSDYRKDLILTNSCGGWPHAEFKSDTLWNGNGIYDRPQHDMKTPSPKYSDYIKVGRVTQIGLQRPDRTDERDYD